MLGRVAESPPSLFSLSLSVLPGHLLPQKTVHRLLIHSSQIAVAVLPGSPRLYCCLSLLLQGSCCHFSCACTVAFTPSPRGLCLLCHHPPRTMRLGLYHVYPYSMCLSPSLCPSGFSLHSHSLPPSSHILSVWVTLSVCLFPIALFIWTILTLGLQPHTQPMNGSKRGGREW